MTLSEIHNCKKCRGKIVFITTDNLGNTYCGYCGEKVDYMSYFKTTDIYKKYAKLIKNKNANNIQR